MEGLLELVEPIEGVKWEAVGPEIFKNWRHALFGDKPRYTGKGLSVENGKLSFLGEWTTNDGAVIARYTGHIKGCNDRLARTANVVHFCSPNGLKRWVIIDGKKYTAAA